VATSDVMWCHYQYFTKIQKGLCPLNVTVYFSVNIILFPFVNVLLLLLILQFLYSVPSKKPRRRRPVFDCDSWATPTSHPQHTRDGYPDTAMHIALRLRTSTPSNRSNLRKSLKLRYLPIGCV